MSISSVNLCQHVAMLRGPWPRLFPIICLAAIYLANSSLHAQEQSSSKELQSNSEHLEAMANRAGRLSMKYSNQANPSVPQLLRPPVMRSANKDENRDGTVWLWLDGKQPVAALCIWNRGPLWYSENSTLTDDALEVVGWPNATWRSSGVGAEMDHAGRSRSRIAGGAPTSSPRHCSHVRSSRGSARN